MHAMESFICVVSKILLLLSGSIHDEIIGMKEIEQFSAYFSNLSAAIMMPRTIEIFIQIKGKIESNDTMPMVVNCAVLWGQSGIVQNWIISKIESIYFDSTRAFASSAQFLC